MAEKLTTYDPAAALVDDEEIATFMADAFESGDASYIANALGIVARAKGMAQIANQTRKQGSENRGQSRLFEKVHSDPKFRRAPGRHPR